MPDDISLHVLLHANEDLADAFLSKREGGSHLTDGVAERINSIDGVTVTVSHEPAAGFAALRSALEDGSAPMLRSGADIVVLSIGDDVRSLPEKGTPETAVHIVRADLVAAIRIIKEQLGAHVLVANHSTVDPADRTFNHKGVSPETLSLRIQRLDLMLVGVSHDEGISIIDIDRKIAEVGAGRAVTEVMRYGREGCEVIAAEVVRILEDYGFFDDRPLLAQVGAKGGKS